MIADIPLAKTKNDGWEWQIEEANLKPVSGKHDLYFTYTNPNLKNSMNTGVMIDWLYFTDPFPGKGHKDYAAMKNEFWKLLRATVPTTPVMMENPSFMHRASYVFERGNWLVKGKKVEPDVPNSLNPFLKSAPEPDGISHVVNIKAKSTYSKGNGKPYLGAAFRNRACRNPRRPGLTGYSTNASGTIELAELSVHV